MTSDSLLEALIAKRRLAAERLRQTEEWRTYQAVTEATRVLGAAADAVSILAEITDEAPLVPPRASRSELVFSILRSAAQPLTNAELLSTLAALGSPVTGKDPANILSATLARDDRFENVPTPDRKRRWRLRG